MHPDALGRLRRGLARSAERTRRRAAAAVKPARPYERGPVVIGGVGGSGTRVVARIVNELGFFIGTDLNPQEDNLWFTLLFRRPKWFASQLGSDGAQIARTLRYFEQAMAGTLQVDAELRDTVADASVELEAQGRPPAWIAARTESLFASRWLRPRERWWGWKEPNSHFYLDHLDRYFGDRLRVVHVVRHGLDMAWSSNQHQVQRWGPLYGIEVGSGEVDPSASLDFWLAANERAVEAGRLLGDRFMVVNFDELSRDPRSLLGGLLDFLGCPVADAQLAALAARFEVPESVGRYREAGLSSFSPEQLERVRNLGFTVET
jgi:hypothetical protein